MLVIMLASGGVFRSCFYLINWIELADAGCVIFVAKVEQHGQSSEPPINESEDCASSASLPSMAAIAGKGERVCPRRVNGLNSSSLGVIKIP